MKVCIRCALVGIHAMRQLAIRGWLRTMASQHKEDEEAYKIAISTLNGLQTNAATLDIVRRQKATHRVSEYNRRHQMQRYLHRVGIELADLERLNAIHVSGTKGKGSVCAMTESILRSHSLKTGLFVSPHLLEVRERILINGQPLSQASFVSSFWDVYNKLDNTKKDYNDLMPSYFRFLTIMAFSVFLQNKVDLAVVEVGIGGTHDSTNIIQKPVVCGITSLGFDHTDLLGDTLSDIAWHKGGICKKHCPALTVEQTTEAIDTLQQRAIELGAQYLKVVPPLSRYPGPLPELALKGKHQESNASLAIQLANTWLQHHSMCNGTSTDTATGTVSMAMPFLLAQEFRNGLKHCKWSGRNQIVEKENVRYFLDGAHTPESVKALVQWYISETETECRKDVTRLLLFNTTGKRDAHTFLLYLQTCEFQHVVFCPNIVCVTDSPADLANKGTTYERQLACCYANQQTFKDVVLTVATKEMVLMGGSREKVNTRVCASVSEAVDFINSLNPAKVDVLVTGSLHLVGTVMNVLGFTVDNNY